MFPFKKGYFFDYVKKSNVEFDSAGSASSDELLC